jgi:hypothetical protein
MRPQLFAEKSFWIGWPCCNPLFCAVLIYDQLPLGLGLTFCAHEHALIEHAFEAAQCTGLVQSAFVATHAGAGAGGSKWTATFFGFVPEAIARDFCGFIFIHFYLLHKMVQGLMV